MIVESIVLSILVGWIRKGKLKHLGLIEIKGIYLFFVGGIFQVLLFTMANQEGSGIGRLFYDHFYILHLFTYIIIMVPIFLNLKWRGLNLMGLGSILNFIPIAANQGKMPVALPAPYAPNFDLGHVLLESGTRFKMLSDVIFIGPPYPMPKIMSIGDFLIMAGVFWLIQSAMMLEKTNHSKSNKITGNESI
ncbi:DUF5317 domain-containing protein [Petrocella sp. FN5]|uniref:DUF5317 domain-containing protein n=1 Tax=Petrocella sp. FN5 TaxID=3032002 RepID=UPI0023DBCBEF|nr:DUF5317 domain-containing protein [Petrocella sp. FN5]MDF1617105.1 DUF5317 domain-containing protein [Petrocella sp. FN5]